MVVVHKQEYAKFELYFTLVPIHFYCLFIAALSCFTQWQVAALGGFQGVLSFSIIIYRYPLDATGVFSVGLSLIIYHLLAYIAVTFFLQNVKEKS